MKKSPKPALFHWWDWASVGLLYLLLQTVASRLVITTWTQHLYLVQSITSMGFVIGAAGGYSNLPHRTVRWLSFFYLILLLPLQWTRVIDQQVLKEEQLLSVAGRLLFSFSEFFSRRPVEDPLFFIAIMSVAFWILSASAGFYLTRHQNFLAGAIPSAIGILVIQNYDNGVAVRVWSLAFFVLFALLLLGRLNFLGQQKQWREKRVFLSPENSIDLTSSMAIAAGLLIITAWSVPSTFMRIDSARRVWNQITKPWNDFTNRLENAVSALDSPSGGKPGEFYGTELELGLGFPLSDTLMFNVQAPELSFEQKPPRYYWRGRTYDHFAQNQWFTSGTIRETYSPLTQSLPIPNTATGNPVRFQFTTGESGFSLLYAPSQAVWVSRPGSMLTSLAGENEREVANWNASPVLLPGEAYQVEAVLNNPNIQQLREAGTEYPRWVTVKYLQLPDDFSTRIRELASDITASAETPYDKARAITRYLRENIEYTSTIHKPPRNADPLEWVLFEYKKAYCVYYASAEILMLRSLGIPARMAVGFAQGTGTSRGEALPAAVEEIAVNNFTVRKNNAHAWPEVYFPGIGWVEFEPTGNQAPLDRPLPPRDSTNANTPANPFDLLADDNSNFASRDPGIDEGFVTPISTEQSLISPLNLLLIFTALAALTIFLSRRYALSTRLPSIVRTTMERRGFEAPTWILRWEHWVKLSPIERAFESINFGLRQLEKFPPIYATPSERADELVNILPKTAPDIKVLLDEHQTYLYTSRTADANLARRAAFNLRTQITLARIRHFWTGKYSLTMK